MRTVLEDETLDVLHDLAVPVVCGFRHFIEVALAIVDCCWLGVEDEWYG